MGHRCYTVRGVNRDSVYRVGTQILADAGQYLDGLGIDSCVVITDKHVARLYRRLVEGSLGNRMLGWITVPPGEPMKGLDTVEKLYGRLASLGCERGTGVLALGGGVIGDMAGFVAATYVRGLPLIQVPTTLLAMVDSSLGSKVGINLPAGKNLVGAYYSPLEIWADVTVLTTLPDKEWSCGMAEVIKHAVIRGKTLFDYLSGLSSSPAQWDEETLMEVVRSSAHVKIELVGRDLYEQGPRMLLNFGHTLGHALEAALGYTGLTHGEAVAWGMLGAVRLADKLQILEEDFSQELALLLKRWGLLHGFARRLEWGEVVEYLLVDKKRRKGRTRFVLPRSLGRLEVVPVDLEEVEDVFRSLG